jgi:crotonobetainyl-CoA:carnitine CoA-transferase CaiB-like acyl-CoA transferase
VTTVTFTEVPGDTLPPPGPWAPFGLLEGVRVLDLTNSIAGPYATLQLADLGADVAKIEPPEHGDDTRQWGPPFLDGESLWYLSVNRNKSSVALDLRADADREVLWRMLGVCDVVVVNLRPEVQARLGVDYDRARTARADIIHCSITGYGLSGPRADFPCYDLIAEGVSGVMDLTGEADAPPQKIGAPAADLLAGMDAAFAIVAALLDRERTGAGHEIDISLTESMTRFLAPRILSYLGSGQMPQRTGGRDSVISVYQRFETLDDPLTLGLGNDRIFRRFCVTIERPGWADDPRNATNARRRQRREALVDEIQAVLVTRTRVQWLALFEERAIPAGPINTVAEVTADRGLRERGLFYALPPRPGGHAVPQVGTGWQLDGSPNGRVGGPPALGADTAGVLTRWLGADGDAFDAFSAPGASGPDGTR